MRLFNERRIVIGCLSTLALVCFVQGALFSQGERKVYYYDNGTVSSEGMMLEGKPEGYWKTYYPSGQLKSEGNRKNFELDSAWIFYDESGQRTSLITYNKGIRDGASISYQDGILFEKNFYEDGVKTDSSLLYYPTGEVRRMVPISDGKEEGTGYEYGRDGRIITVLEYEDGVLRIANKVNRYDDQGKKRGEWLEFHPNGVIAMQGYYMNDLKNGIFKTFDKQGNLLTLEKYREGMLVKDSEESVILDLRSTFYSDGSVKSSGGYVDGVKEGTHRIYDREGNVLSGEVYEQGVKVAEGLVDKSGGFQGPWKEFYESGELRAEGEYLNSERTGEWRFYHRNGQLAHRGKYVEGLPQGEWKWYFEDGDLRREEYYRRGKEDGASVEYDEAGNVITKGTYIAGYKDGEWFYHVGDHTEKGSYVDGERSGVWIYEYPDGKLNFEGEYLGGLPVGKHRWYHPNGQLKKEGRYSSGVRVGTWETFDESGVQTLEVKYKDGREYKINGRKVTSAEAVDEEDSALP